MAQQVIFNRTYQKFESPKKDRKRAYPDYAYDFELFISEIGKIEDIKVFRAVKQLNLEFGSVYWNLSDNIKELEIATECTFPST
jgi:hypothetical protein